jgi:hypothetical protein
VLVRQVFMVKAAYRDKRKFVVSLCVFVRRFKRERAAALLNTNIR